MAHHTHKCKNCKKACVDCNAGRVDNYDGWPEVLCSAEAAYVTFVCEDCEDLVSCANCGEWHPDWELRKDDGYLYCLSCWRDWWRKR